MTDLMKKKYDHDFLNYTSGELVDKRKVDKERALPAFSPGSSKEQRADLSKPSKPKEKSPQSHKLPKGWMCNICDPESEFATAELINKHIEEVHLACTWD